MSRFFTERTDKTKRENYEDLCILVRENLQISHDFQILLKHGQNETVFLPYSRRHCYEKREDCLLVATIMEKPLSNLSVVPTIYNLVIRKKLILERFRMLKKFLFKVIRKLM